MKLFFTPLIFTFLLCTAFGQAQFDPTKLYKIPNDLAERLYLYEGEEDLVIPDYFFTQVLDSLSTISKANLPIGHYLYVSAYKEKVDVKLYTKHTLTAKVLLDNKHLIVKIFDAEQKNISNAKLSVDGKALAYDAKTETYTTKYQKKEGLIRIANEKELVFYDLDRYDNAVSVNYKRWRWFKNGKTGHYILKPIRVGRSVIRFFKRGFSGDGWYSYTWRRWRNRIKQKKTFKGYVLTNKPTYRHGDTLKVTAYLVSKKGKISKQNIIHFQLKGYNYSRIKKMKINKAGKYYIEIPLSDSMRLDANYTIEFTNKNFHPFRTTIRLEDYQLDEFSLEFNMPKENYVRGEKPILQIEAKDKNGFTIPDGNAQLVLTTVNVNKFYANEVLVPDTLWSHKTPLKSRGLSQIIVPDSIFPLADMKIKADILVTNTAGEIQKSNTHFNYKGAEYQIDMKLKDGVLWASQTKLGNATVDTAILHTVTNNTVTTQKKRLPFKIPINFLANNYSIESANANKYLSVSAAFESAVEVTAANQMDSLIIEIKNPHKIPLNWKLQSSKKTISEGQSNVIFFRKAIKNTNKNQRFLRYQYIWGGRLIEDNITISNYTKTLNIEVNQKEMAAPGEAVSVKIMVKDYKGKPAQNVNLSAVTLNAKFGNKKSYKISSTSYKRSRKPFLYDDDYDIEKVNKVFKMPLTKHWYDTLSLNSSLFYRLRYEINKTGYFMQYDTIQIDSFYHTVAQFSPFLIKNNKAQPIYMIYCNRKLVYYYDVDDAPPYAFVGKEGYNQITIRGKDYEYRIDSVLLKKGMKLTFSIDVDITKKTPYKIKVKATPSYLQTREINLLQATILHIRNWKKHTQIYIWDDSTNIHKLPKHSHQKDIKVGPFHYRNKMQYVQYNDYTVSFAMEEGFSFIIDQGRDKLYKNDWLNMHKKHYLPNQLPQKHYLPNQLPLQYPYTPIISPAVLEFDENQKRLINFTPPIKYQSKGTAKYIFKTSINLDSIACIGLEYPVEEVLVYKPSTRVFKSLSPGKYRLFIIKKNSEWFVKDFEIQSNTLLYHNFENITLEKDSINHQFEKYFLQVNTLTYSVKKKDDKFIDYYFDGEEISGTITDESGETLIGVSVRVKGTNIGVVTDFNGKYTIKVPKGIYQLVYSYTGFESQEIHPYTRSGVMDVILNEGVQLNSVVVTAMGIRKENESLGYAVVQIRGSRSAATSYYVDGIRVGKAEGIPIKDETNESPLFADFDYEKSSGIRSNFKDYAFWQPSLSTDKNGEAFFTASLPDDITSWNTYVLGMDKHKRGGIGFAKTKAMKPLLAQLSIPRFLIAGDEVEFVGKTVNYTDNSFDVKTWFEWNDKKHQAHFASVKDVLIDKFQVKIPLEVDSFRLTYVLSNNNYTDGEERAIPIFKKGVQETVGDFYVLSSDTIIKVVPNPNFGEMTILTTNSQLEVLLKDVDQLIKYPYGCNEQTASRLMALLLEKQIREQLNEPFAHEIEIKKAINRLEETQHPTGYWGWWAEGKFSNWISRHVTKALLMAEKNGYSSGALETSLRYFTNHLTELKGRNLLLTLDMLSSLNQQMNYATSLTRLDSMEMTLHDKLLAMKIKQKQGLPYSLDSLAKYEKKTIYGGIYFGEKSRYMLRNQIQTSLLAYQLYKNAGKANKTKAMRQFFLHSRSNVGFGYRNTFHTASVLSTILPDILAGSIPIFGTKLLMSTLDGGSEQVLDYGKIYTNDQPFLLKKEGKSPVFLTTYQQFLNPNPQKKENWFVVKTSLQQNGEILKVLKKGSLTQLVVELEVKEAADFVMIEIPIPASCTYDTKPQGSFNNREVHREYFKEKTAIFCRFLPKGHYVYVLDLQARFSGTFSLNPTKVEQMYFPVFYGRNEIKKVVVE